jgi:steroid delta-isomerase-like uncharacterized protein
MGLFDRISVGGGLRVKNNDAKLTRVDGSAAVKTYFELWNERRMDEAVNLFADDCTYEDTLYPSVFRGKAQLQSHLFNVASSLPSTFRFVVDAIAEDKSTGYVGVQWHVESDTTPLPFTRGSSMYQIDPTTGKITSGFDVPEPVVKSGGISLFILKQASIFIEDRSKLIPLVGWVFYCWLLFLSDVAPGYNALSMDPNTWNQVLALSWNFWLVLPIGFPQWDIDSLSPVLEGLFNFLLAYAGKRSSLTPSRPSTDHQLPVTNTHVSNPPLTPLLFHTFHMPIPHTPPALPPPHTPSHTHRVVFWICGRRQARRLY